MFSKTLLIVLCLMVWLSFGAHIASAQRSAPHNQLDCADCHSVIHGDLDVMYAGEVNAYDLACLSCHDQAIGTAQLRVSGHQNQHCYRCHDPHYQSQVVEKDMFLVEGQVVSVSGKQLKVSLNTMITNQYKRMILIPNTEDLYVNFYIEKNTNDTIFVKYGSLDDVTQQGATFRIAYGKYIRYQIVGPDDQLHEITFSGPVGAGSFADGDQRKDGICEVCHTQTKYHTNNGDPTQHYPGQHCTSCHPHNASQEAFAPGCTGCHDFPPATGVHQVHTDVGLLQDGLLLSPNDTSRTSDYADRATTYLYGCGYCHPSSSFFHQNWIDNAGGGQAEIVLYDPAAPPTTIKSLNPVSARYEPGDVIQVDSQGIRYTVGTCRDVYCHSSGQRDTDNRDYQIVTWVETKSAARCSLCHGIPPTYIGAPAGLPGSNSHYRKGSADKDSGHILGVMWKHFGPDLAAGLSSALTCNICHVKTVQGADGVDTTFVRTNPNGVPFYYPKAATCSSADCHTSTTNPVQYRQATISNTAFHVNGFPDVDFSQQPFRTTLQMDFTPSGWSRAENYDEWIPASATYNYTNRRCSNVACHSGRQDPAQSTDPIWGEIPEDACSLCHDP